MIRSAEFRGHQAARFGFTLVELLVAAAICVLIMTILATAFQTSIDTMRQMRSLGDMQDQLRAAMSVIQKDLQANHFLSEDNKTNQGLNLSNQYTTLPIGGYFKIVSPAPTTATLWMKEGYDDNQLVSTRATNHQLQFTSILPGGQNLYIAPIGNGTTTSTAAEIAYYLPTAPTSYTTSDQSVPLYNLIRRQRLVAVSIGALQLPPPPVDWTVISGPTGNPARPNALADLVSQSSGNRLNIQNAATTPYQIGDDVLLSNVISFEVKVSGSINHPPTGVIWPQPFTLGSATDHPFDYLPSFAPFSSTYDTGALPATPSTTQDIMRVKSLQIRVRIYDPRMQNARQVTIVQDM